MVIQRSPIPQTTLRQTSNWSGTVFAVSYSKPALGALIIELSFIFLELGIWFSRHLLPFWRLGSTVAKRSRLKWLSVSNAQQKMTYLINKYLIECLMIPWELNDDFLMTFWWLRLPKTAWDLLDHCVKTTWQWQLGDKDLLKSWNWSKWEKDNN